MESAASLSRRLDQLDRTIGQEKRAIRESRRRLQEAKAEQLTVIEALKALGFEFHTQAKR